MDLQATNAWLGSMELTKQTLDSVLTPAVRGQDLYIVINLLADPASQDQTWDFMRSHFDQLAAKTELHGVLTF